MSVLVATLQYFSMRAAVEAERRAKDLEAKSEAHYDANGFDEVCLDLEETARQLRLKSASIRSKIPKPRQRLLEKAIENGLLSCLSNKP